MNFKPRTEQEIAENKLWPKDDYDFEIAAAFDKTSKAGRSMIELKLRLSGPQGFRFVTDYLLAERPEKLLHAATSLDLLDGYNSGNLSAANFRGKRGRLTLGIERDKQHKWPDKNIVLDYRPAAAGQVVAIDAGKEQGAA